ncbi:MAG: prephenate dehydratase [Propionibacteriales bacterium]|nr:prephenate dehydratase [Propionibacteriales bacterium]
MPGVPPARYAYLGPEGTFTEAALRSLPAAATAALQPCGSVGAALDAVREGDADGAVVPIENSVEGAVPVTLDALSNGDLLMITREMHVEVQFSLLAKHGTKPEDIRRVATHPHAEAQCRRWLATHLPTAEVVLEASTALAAAMVAGPNAPYDAAIAAPIAADTYRLATLASHIADRAGAVTRFVLVSRPGAPQPPTGADKTSLVVYIHENRPGALLELLEQFAVRGVDLTWIQSRPTGSALGKYCFTIDAEGHVFDARVGEALMGLRRTSDEVRFLGSYPRADGVVTSVTTGTSDSDFAEAAGWLSSLRLG